MPHHHHKQSEPFSILKRISTFAQRKRWIRDVASALQHLHEHEYTHGDLQLQNILISGNLKTKHLERSRAILTNAWFIETCTVTANIREAESSSSSKGTRTSHGELETGDLVKIAHHGSYYQREAVILNPHWNGMAKVQLISSGLIRSYTHHELIFCLHEEEMKAILRRGTREKMVTHIESSVARANLMPASYWVAPEWRQQVRSKGRTPHDIRPASDMYSMGMLTKGLLGHETRHHRFSATSSSMTTRDVTRKFWMRCIRADASERPRAAWLVRQLEKNTSAV